MRVLWLQETLSVPALRRHAYCGFSAPPFEMAFRMALLGRHPLEGLLFHSDRGSQYTSDAYQALLADVGATVSMSRTGNCYDNAVTESFFGTLKGECVERTSFQTRGQAKQTIFEYVECFYNRVRRHSSLGYVSPAAYEQLVS